MTRKQTLRDEVKSLRADLQFAEQMCKAFGDRNKELVVENIELRRRWKSVPFAAIRDAFTVTGDEILGAWLESMAKPDPIADGPTANTLDGGA